MPIQRRRLPLVFLALALCAGCGSVAKTAKNSLEGVKGAYVAANDVRNAYCKPLRDPKPQVCIDSYKPMNAAYHVLVEGTRLLEAYVVTKDAGLAAQLNALAAETPRLILEVTEIAGQFRQATGTPIPTSAPVAPVK